MTLCAQSKCLVALAKFPREVGAFKRPVKIPQVLARAYSDKAKFDLSSFLTRIEALNKPKEPRMQGNQQDRKTPGWHSHKPESKNSKLRSFSAAKSPGSKSQTGAQAQQRSGRFNQTNTRPNMGPRKTRTAPIARTAQAGSTRTTQPQNKGELKAARGSETPNASPALEALDTGLLAPLTRASNADPATRQRKERTTRKPVQAKRMSAPRRALRPKQRPNTQSNVDVQLRYGSGSEFLSPSEGLEILMSKAGTQSGYAQIEELDTLNLAHSLATSSVTFNTRVWSVINNREPFCETMSALVHHRVAGKFDDVVVKSSKDSHQTVAHLLNRNRSLDINEKRLINDLASGNIPVKRVSQANLPVA